MFRERMGRGIGAVVNKLRGTRIWDIVNGRAAGIRVINQRRGEDRKGRLKKVKNQFYRLNTSFYQV